MKIRRISHIRRMQPRPCHRGISLLDTLVTVSLIGSVSAMALPRLSNLPREARVAVVEHTAGAVRSASSLAHMKCMVEAACAMHTGVATIEMGGERVRLTHGHPAGGEPDGLALAVALTGFEARHAPGHTLLIKDGAPNPELCAVAYTEPEAPGRSPMVGVVTSGC